MVRRLLSCSAGVASLAFLLLVDPPAPHPASARSSNPPVKYTGAPGESNCSSCHTKGLNDGVGSLAIVIANSPTSYVPNTTYAITVTLDRTGQSRWGFEMTVLRNSDDLTAGTLARTTDFTKEQSGTVSGNTRTYEGHTQDWGQDGTYAGTTGSVQWTFDWTAPAAGAGAVTFYAAGVAADNSGTSGSGDYVYTKTLVLEEQIPSAVLRTTWGMIKRQYQ